MLIWTFHSTHETMAAEGAMKQQGVKFNIIPTPRAITKSCGLSMWVKEDWTAKELLERILKDQLPMKALFEGEGENFRLIYEDPTPE